MRRQLLAAILHWMSSFLVSAAELSSDDIQQIISTESTYCPKQMCADTLYNTSAVRYKSPDVPCAFCQYRCLCDDRCGEFGDCCTNKAFVSDPRVPEYECVSIKLRSELRTTPYFMIAKCPHDTRVSNTTAWKCEHPSNDDPKTILPVKSENRNGSWVTYRNQFCALCHEVAPSDMTTWRIFIDCKQYLRSSLATIKSFDDAVDFVRNNAGCKFELDTIEGNPERECQLYPKNIISSCNVTGSWLLYNETLEEYCKAYFTLVWVGTSFYANIYCAACNLEQCRGELTTECFVPVEPPITGGRVDLPPLSMLINFNPSEDTTPDIIETYEEETICNCSQGFIYDKYKDACRELLCPDALQFNGAECSTIVGKSLGLAFTLNFILTAHSEVSIREGDYKMVAELLTDILSSKLNLQVTNLRTDLSFRDNVSESTLISIKAKMYMICEQPLTYDSFSAAAVRAINSQWTLDINKNSNSFFGFMDPEADINPENSSLLYSLLVIPISSHLGNGTQNTETDKTQKYTLIHHIYDQDKDYFIRSGTFIFFRVSALYNCSQVSFSDDEYSMEELPPYSVDVSGITLGVGQYEKFSDETIRTCSDVIQTFNIRGCYNITNVTTSLTDMLTSDNLSIQNLVTLLALSISLLCLVITLLTYLVFKDLRTLPGKNNMLLVITLTTAQVIYLLGAIDTHDSVVCKIIGVLLHYFWLASFFWMNVCSLHVFLIFRDILRSRGKSGSKRLLLYSIYAFTAPGVIVALTVLCFHFISGGKTIGYGEKFCYLSTPLSIGLAFALPLGLIITANLIFFVATLRALREAPKLESNQEHRHSSLVYIRLSSLTGVTWILGFVAAWVQEEALWYLFIVFCGGQGIYIFFAFVCNERVLKSYQRLLCKKRSLRKKRLMYYKRHHGEFDSSGKKTVSETFNSSFQTSKTKQTSFSS